MMLTLTASIMYWSLQQGTKELDMCPSPSDTATSSPNASPAPSISGEDYSYYSGEVSSITFDDGGILDDASSDAIVSSPSLNKSSPNLLDHEVSHSSTADSALNSSGTSYSRGSNVYISSEGSTLTFDDVSYVDSDIEVTSGSLLEVAEKVKPDFSNGDGSTVTNDNAGGDNDEPEVSSHV